MVVNYYELGLHQHYQYKLMEVLLSILYLNLLVSIPNNQQDYGLV